MICDLCKKNEAVMHYTEVRDSRNTEYNLCRECAELKGLAKSLNLALSSLGDMLAGMIRDISTEQDDDNAAQCPKCGLALTDFKKLGRLGCPGCYQVFNASLKPLVRQIHGINDHLGKAAPTSDDIKAAPSENRMERLRQELQAAVLKEEYEKAADLRDQIRELETSGAR
ncbi:MAG: UvrB/UvrC motif-containing protein [Candidatus Edwardsbacteria bacterium]|nr:UvrB/UvrC motif-containing protein [Candidatus Edwardsbacteria bacterium]MBU1576045.1 UvrB/UvrC motif-containing protein [Candidatus Edwardsbacteria bacterium]MBU2462473.1 UvrB/UvrC motif-containing protein [Candidatus Edwardsbacteria bacterium]MBU2594320.1 UvrB/UvrC motif-containing protein [Candidatus Edwardsbacteria bacterium]